MSRILASRPESIFPDKTAARGGAHEEEIRVLREKSVPRPLQDYALMSSKAGNSRRQDTRSP
jgi:hypothetical protein